MRRTVAPNGARRTKAPAPRGCGGLRVRAGEAGGREDYAERAPLDLSTRAVNPAGSLIAMSESTLRSRSISAFFRPFMNTEYDRPLSRAPALMRAIHSLRISRFLFLRSR